jgi:CDP-glycerol glycerophosphotransferase
MIFDFILNILLSFLSYFVSKNKNQILMGSRDGKFVENTKYFFLYLVNKKSSLDFYWITKDKDLYKKFKNLDYPVIYLYSFKGFKAILKSNFILVNQLVNDSSFFPMLPGKFNIMNLCHGTPFKRSTIYDMKHQNSMEHTIKIIIKKIYNQPFKSVLSNSEITSMRRKEEFNSKDFPILGFPRNDVFFNNSLIFENYFNILKLNQYSKIYLYCPTLRDKPTRKPFSNSFLLKLNQYLLETNSIFLIKWHPYEKNQYHIENFSQIKVISKKVDDLYELLPQVDILITDYSNVSFDFSLLEKPIIFYPYDYEDYVNNVRNVFEDYFEAFPGPFVKNENDLLSELSKIESIFENDKEYIEKYKKFKLKFQQFTDGNSCDRLYDYLMSSMR